MTIFGCYLNKDTRELDLTKGVGYFSSENDSRKELMPHYTGFKFSLLSEEEFNPLELEALRKEKIAKVNKLRQDTLDSNIQYSVSGTPKLFQSDIVSKTSWLINAEGIDSQTEVEWICADNTIASITKAMISEICLAVSTRDSEATKQCRLRKDALLAMTTKEQVLGYDINTVYE